MPYYEDGQIAVDSQGRRKKYHAATDTWELDVAPGAPVPAAVGRPSTQDTRMLNDLSAQAASAAETRQIYDQTKDVIRRFQPNPWKGTIMDIAVPDEKSGFLGRIGAAVVGGPAQLFGAITPQDIDDYQLLRSRQQERVGTRQLEQKGMQTESDAARYMLADISPMKSTNTNLQIADLGTAKAARVQARVSFYSRWRQKYGSLQAVDERGRAVEQAFQDTLQYYKDQITSGRINRNVGPSNPGPAWKVHR